LEGLDEIYLDIKGKKNSSRFEARKAFGNKDSQEFPAEKAL